jgi:hypothetical protein
LGGAWDLQTDETYLWNLYVALDRGWVQLSKEAFDGLHPELLHDLETLAVLDDRYRVLARKGLLEQDAWLERVRQNVRRGT